MYLMEWNFFLSRSLSLSPLDRRLTRWTAATESVAVTRRNANPPAIPAMAAVDTTMLPEGGTSVGATYVATSDEALRGREEDNGFSPIVFCMVCVFV